MAELIYHTEPITASFTDCWNDDLKRELNNLKGKSIKDDEAWDEFKQVLDIEIQKYVERDRLIRGGRR